MIVFLNILKIIGIVLLCILAFLLLLVFLLLFVPLRYNVRGAYSENKPDVDASVTWLLHFVSVRLHYDNDKKSLILRILGIKIMDIFNPKPKKEKKKRVRKEKTKKEKNRKKEEIKEDRAEDANEAGAITSENDTVSESSPASDLEDEFLSEEDVSKDDNEQLSIFEKIGVFLEKFFEKAESTYESLAKRYEDGVKKAEDTYKTIDAWIYVLSKDKTKEALEKVKDDVVKLLWHLRPRKGNVNAVLGLKDPATTGTIYGYYWLFIGLYAGIINLVPDFENEIIDVNGYLKGHIRANHLVAIGWRFLFNKKYKYLRKINERVEYVKEHKK